MAADTSKVLKLNWQWWLHHFGSCGLSSDFARQCWVKRENEVGERLVSYKLDGERIMEMKAPPQSTVTKSRADIRRDVRARASPGGGRLARDFLRPGISSEANLGLGEMSDWDGSDDDPPPVHPDASRLGSPSPSSVQRPVLAPASDDDGGGGDSEDPPTDDDPDNAFEPHDPAPATSPGPPSLRSKPPAAQVRSGSGSGTVTTGVGTKRGGTHVQPSPPPKGRRLSTQMLERVEAKQKRRDDQMGDNQDKPAKRRKGDGAESEARTEASLRSVLTDAKDKFDESIDMWDCQNAMEWLPNVINTEHQVVNAKPFYWTDAFFEN